MPTYDYICESCGYEFEKFQSISALPLRRCPRCTRMQLKRLIGTGSGVIFKGSGFYQTDYRSQSYKKAEESEKPKPSEKKTTGESKQEEKTVARSDSGSVAKNKDSKTT